MTMNEFYDDVLVHDYDVDAFEESTYSSYFNNKSKRVFRNTLLSYYDEAYVDSVLEDTFKVCKRIMKYIFTNDVIEAKLYSTYKSDYRDKFGLLLEPFLQLLEIIWIE